MNGSLHRRLAVGLAVSLVLLAGLQWLLAGIAIERLLKAQLAQRLERDAENLLAALHTDADGRLALDATRVGGEYQRPFSGHYYRIVVTQDGQTHDITSRSLWDGGLALPPTVDARQRETAARGPQGQSLWVVSVQYEKRARRVVIAVAEDLAPLQSGLRQWHLLYGLLSLAVVLLVLAVQRWVVQRSLRPLAELQGQLQALERGERTELDARVPDEIAPLVAQLNSMLGMLLRRSQRSREALGNLAHALKTRLAVLVQATESPELAAHPALMQRLVDSNTLMRHAIERELRRARLMGGAHPAQRSSVAAVIDQLGRTLGILYADKKPDIRIDVPSGLALAMDPEDLLELLGNLMDNACAWCTGVVGISIRHADDIGITIEDDGPGCPATQLEALAERGFRADESRPGHGLGLAIVRDLVDSYGGALEFGHSTALGGLRVTAHLPGHLGHTVPNTRRD
ncbi:MAG: ATP-binding protein [Pseudomonadota bacterium]